MRFLLFIIWASITGTMSAQSSQTNIEFTSYTLKNGLQVILHEDHSTPIVAVTVMYHVGSKNETPEQMGMAHFFEHLTFEGSVNIKPGEFDQYVEGAGGMNNANTSPDRTFYYELFPSNQLELGLWMESERMMHAQIDQHGIDIQRAVVKEEKRQRIDNRPYGQLLGKTMEAVYKTHPYRWTPIGTMESLNAAKAEDFEAFYALFYVPNNAVLSISGDLDIEETKKLIQDYFGPIPKGKQRINREFPVEEQRSAATRDTVWGKDALPMVVQAYLTPAMGTPDYYAVKMLNRVLSGGESSRLNLRVVDQDQLALFCSSFNFDYEDPGVTLAYAMANMGGDPAEVEKAMVEEIERLQTELISNRELQKLKNQTISSFVRRQSTMAGIAENLATYHLFYGDANLINTEINRFLLVSTEDIQRVAQKYYSAAARRSIYFLKTIEDVQ